MTTSKCYNGVLEIDTANNVIYFHLNNERVAHELGTGTPLTIHGLPKGILNQSVIDVRVGSLVQKRESE